MVTSVKRDRRLLQSAKGRACQWCFKRDGTVVAAHSNQLKHGKGMGLKASDEAIAWLCSVCHAELDQGRWMTKEQRRLMWNTAHERTVRTIRAEESVEAFLLRPRPPRTQGPPQIRPGQDVHPEDDDPVRGEGVPDRSEGPTGAP